jgi:hypothetical protein
MSDRDRLAGAFRNRLLDPSGRGHGLIFVALATSR